MIIEHWNLKFNPFLQILDSGLWVALEPHEEILSRLAFAGENGRLGSILTGPPGVGKTALLHELAARGKISRRSILRLSCSPGGTRILARQLSSLTGMENQPASWEEVLFELWRAGQHHPDSLPPTLLCLDDAHPLLADQTLPLLESLLRLQRRHRKTGAESPLFSLILAGPPSLARAVQADPTLGSLLSFVCEIPPLTLPQTTVYIQHHMRAAGGDTWSFDQDAIQAVHHYSGGLPRFINLLCDYSLAIGAAARAPQLTAHLTTQAAAHLNLPPSSAPPPKPPEENL